MPTLPDPIAFADDDAPRLPNPDGRGRRRPLSIKSKAAREREIIDILEPRSDAGLSVPEIALLICLSRYQTSLILYNLVHAEVVEAQPSGLTTPRGGRPPVVFALTVPYRTQRAMEAAKAARQQGATEPATHGRRYTTEVAK
jgi:predicted ArsR family transcriptional regulator